MSIAAVVLAAGASRRLGRPKQTLVIGGVTLITRAVRIAVMAGLSPVIVVIRKDAEFVAELRESGCMIVINDEAEEGMASSIRHGIREAKMLQAIGAAVMTCDQVALRAEHLLALTAQPERVTGSRYAGRVGIPAYFPAVAFDALLELKGDVGARDLLREAAAIRDEDLALDLDTEVDLQTVSKHFGM